MPFGSDDVERDNPQDLVTLASRPSPPWFALAGFESFVKSQQVPMLDSVPETNNSIFDSFRTFCPNRAVKALMLLLPFLLTPFAFAEDPTTPDKPPETLKPYVVQPIWEVHTSQC